MSKAKYKLGTLVQIKDESGEIVYGTVESVITKKAGYSYILDGSHPVEESEIVNAYRAIAKAKGKRAKKPATSKEPEFDA